MPSSLTESHQRYLFGSIYVWMHSLRNSLSGASELSRWHVFADHDAHEKNVSSSPALDLVQCLCCAESMQSHYHTSAITTHTDSQDTTCSSQEATLSAHLCRVPNRHMVKRGELGICALLSRARGMRHPYGSSKHKQYILFCTGQSSHPVAALLGQRIKTPSHS